MTESDYDPAKAAATGAALLDEQEPGWWEKINPATLEMGSLCECVLGQVFGSYGSAPRKLSPNGDVDEERGFDLPGGYRGSLEEWDALKAAWVAEVDKRREAAGKEG